MCVFDWETRCTELGGMIMYRIGIVGAGAIGGCHKEAFKANPTCELAAVCDTVLDRAEKLADGTNARVYDDYKKMQEAEQLDAVILNLPHFLHESATVYFLEKGISVLVEKPMAINTAECDAMIAASKKSGAKLAVGHVQRYHNCYTILKNIIAENRLGKLCGIREVRNCDYFTGRPAWFLNKKLAGGGILMNYGAHSMDKIFYTTGLKVENVVAMGNNFLTEDSVEAIAQLLVKFEGGVNGTFCYCGCKVPSEYRTDFYFTNGQAQVRDGWELWVSEAGGEFVCMEGCNSWDLFEPQLAEFVKLLNGEESRIVTPEYGRDVIAVLEKALAQI